MSTHSVLGQVALGFSPMVDAKHDVVATRLTVFPWSPEVQPDAGALLEALAEVWPDADVVSPGATDMGQRPLDPTVVQRRASNARPPVVLNVTTEGLLYGVMAALPGPRVMVEVPGFLAGDPAQAEAIQKLRASGSVLMLKGRPLQPIAPAVLECFSHSLVDVTEERRDGLGGEYAAVRKITTVQTGVRTQADVQRAFQHGAVAVLGWSFEDTLPPKGSRTTPPPGVKTVMDLIQGIDRDESPARLEAILKREPTVGFRLMRYLNSPAFGLTVEINSFGHALMLLGARRLKRWLVLLLASATKHPGGRAMLFAAVRRGLMMEELARHHNDADLQGEMFICGVFSMLDRLLQQPLSDLLAGVQVPERVRLSLSDEGGPFQAHLDLVRAIEQASRQDIRDCAERLLLGPAESNAALLAALTSARQLD